MVLDRPFDAGHDIAGPARSLRVQHFQRVELHPGSNADYSRAVVSGSDGAGYVRAVPLVIRVLFRVRHEVVAAGYFQVRVRADAGIQHADAHTVAIRAGVGRADADVWSSPPIPHGTSSGTSCRGISSSVVGRSWSAWTGRSSST